MKHALTIAGSDSSGGAGIQADLKTFSAHGVFGMSVITAVTAQNTQGVLDVHPIPPEMVRRQILAVFEDIRVDAVKIGMVSNTDTARAIAETLHEFQPANVVLDPVMISKSGFPLLSEDAVTVLKDVLFPLATLITPNIPEAQWITGETISTISEMEAVAKLLYGNGPMAVLIKGGHRKGDATDVLYDGSNWHRLKAARIETVHTHGTGCTLSSAIAASLAKGEAIYPAVVGAKQYVRAGIASGLAIGKGIGPLNHFVELYEKAGMKLSGIKNNVK